MALALPLTVGSESSGAVWAKYFKPRILDISTETITGQGEKRLKTLYVRT